MPDVEHPPHASGTPAAIPRGQKFYDNVFLLLALGTVIMLVVYTGWGIWEIMTMPTSTLP